MRDEDLAKLPKSIDQWEVRQFLERLGIKHTDVFEVRIGVRSVEIGMYASDEHGRRMREEVDIDVMDLSQEKPDTIKGYGDAKLHRITIPLTQVWEKPEDCR